MIMLIEVFSFYFISFLKINKTVKLIYFSLLLMNFVFT